MKTKLAIALLIISQSAMASTKVCFKLDNPTMRENGKPLPISEIAGNTIYWTRVRADNGKTDSGKSSLSTDTSRCLFFTVKGSYQFKSTVTDTNGLESKQCNPVNWSF